MTKAASSDTFLSVYSYDSPSSTFKKSSAQTTYDDEKPSYTDISTNFFSKSQSDYVCRTGYETSVFAALEPPRGDQFEGGSKKTITLSAGPTLSEGFTATSSHLDHIYVYVDGVCYKPVSPEGVTFAKTVDIEVTMPDADISFAITFGEAMTITTVTNANITSVLYYTDDPGYSESVTTAVPGNSLYVVATTKTGYLFTGASVNGGEKVGLSNEAGLSYALLSIPDTATAISVTLYAEASHTSSVSASTNGTITMNRSSGLYATGETVSLTVTPASGYVLDGIAITKAGGTASGVSATIDAATGNASFVMPDFDVKVAATFKVDPDAGNKATVSLTYDSDEFTVSTSSSNVTYDTNPFTVAKNTSVYLQVTDTNGNKFHVKVVTGTTTIIDADATADEDSGEYTFGKSFQVTGDTTITITAA